MDKSGHFKQLKNMRKPKKNLLNFLLLTAFSIGLHSCYYDNIEELYGKNQPPPIDTTQVVSFANDVTPFINNTCAISGCHISGTGRQPLTNYNEIKNAIENFNLKNRVESGNMPPGGNADETGKQKLFRWINNGYPNN